MYILWTQINWKILERIEGRISFKKALETISLHSCPQYGKEGKPRGIGVGNFGAKVMKRNFY